MAAGSGPTPITTSGAPAVVIPAQVNQCFLGGYLSNGSVAGQYSIDGGATWQYLPASMTVPLGSGLYLHGVMIQPTSGDLSGVSGELF